MSVFLLIMLLAAKSAAASGEQCHIHPGMACAGPASNTSGTSLMQVRSKRGYTAMLSSTAHLPLRMKGSCSEDTLQFLHIPKNAGKTIQNVGLKHGLRWGTHAFKAIYHESYHKLDMPDGNTCPVLHVPPDMVPEPSPYRGREVFCVKRNPYSRAVSEYLWERTRFAHRRTIHSRKGEICPGCNRFSMCSAAGMNFFLNKVLHHVKAGSKYVNRCHMLPQSRYMWTENGEAMCHDIIPIDDLQDSFTKLMKKKQCKFTSLGKEHDNSKKWMCPHLSEDDLSAKNKQMINSIYKMDFALLKYPKKGRRHGVHKSHWNKEVTAGGPASHIAFDTHWAAHTDLNKHASKAWRGKFVKNEKQSCSEKQVMDVLENTTYEPNVLIVNVSKWPSTFGPEDFEELVRNKKQPVLLQGTHAPWSAEAFCREIKGLHRNVNMRKYTLLKHKHKWLRSFTKVKMQKLCSRCLLYHKCAQVENFAKEEGQSHRHMSLRQKCSALKSSEIPYAKTPAKQPLKLINFKGPPYRPRWGYTVPMLWIGGHGSQTPLHKDAMDNIAMQITGTKRWYLFSPLHSKRLEYQDNFRKAGQHWHSDGSHIWSHNKNGKCHLDGVGPFWSKYNMLNEHTAPPDTEYVTVDVQPGDSLYVPHYWGHMVENIGTNIMSNFWLKDSWSCCAGSRPSKTYPGPWEN